jgi:hypothetical protein
LRQSLIDPLRCDRGLKSLRNYRKEWDEDRATFRDRPFHNWASHGADAFRTFAQGFVEPEMVRLPQRYRDRVAEDRGSRREGIARSRGLLDARATSRSAHLDAVIGAPFRKSRLLWSCEIHVRLAALCGLKPDIAPCPKSTDPDTIALFGVCFWVDG